MCFQEPKKPAGQKSLPQVYVLHLKHIRDRLLVVDVNLQYVVNAILKNIHQHTQANTYI